MPSDVSFCAIAALSIKPYSSFKYDIQHNFSNLL